MTEGLRLMTEGLRLMTEGLHVRMEVGHLQMGGGARADGGGARANGVVPCWPEFSTCAPISLCCAHVRRGGQKPSQFCASVQS